MREAGGVAGMIDVRQAEILVAQAGEAVVETERQIEQTENAISVLIGHPPEAVPRGRPLLQQLTLPQVPTGVPSALFERRPDIRQAEDQLAAATARIGVAKSDFYPAGLPDRRRGGRCLAHRRLMDRPPGTLQHRPVDPSADLQHGTHPGRRRLGRSAGPGRRRAIPADDHPGVPRGRRRAGRASQAPGVPRSSRRPLALAAGDAARLSNIRYKGGVTSYLEVLDSERQFFDAELGLVRSNRDELLAIVRLYKALGGGWQEEQETRAASSTGEREKK